MHIPDDLNNRRVRQLIEQFNAEEAYEEELRSAIEQLCKVAAASADLADLIAALRKMRWALPTPPQVNAVGLWVETQSTITDIRSPLAAS
ncbi:MAG TPA: hypothetical protein VGU64_13040 [Terriglobales bacterium]|nr:hypothetical protein [Terriglobales bacterium]